MGITCCSDWITKDSRFKAWGRLVRSEADLNLNADRGYCLTSEWVKWTDSVSINGDEFLVVAAETGSRARHGYTVKLIQGGDEPRSIQKSDMRAVIEGARVAGLASEEQEVKSKNSDLYLFGLYCYLHFKGFAIPAPAERTTQGIVQEIETLEARLAELRAQLAERQQPADAP